MYLPVSSFLCISHTHTHTHAHTHTHITYNAHTHPCTHTHTHTHTHITYNAHTHPCTHTCTLIFVFICPYFYLNAHCLLFNLQGTSADLNLGKYIFIGGYKTKADLPPSADIKTNFTGAVQKVKVKN